MQEVHSTAIISEQAELADDIVVGPYAVIEAGVKVGAGTRIGPHAVIHSNTRLGSNNTVHAHVVLGDLPQHLGYEPETNSGVVIGDNNTFREMVTVHRALYDGKDTVIGSKNFFMVGSHVAHDCIVKNNVTVVNNVGLGGHVHVDDYATIGGNVGVHQFVRIGAYTMVAASCMIRKDVLPFSMIGGEPARHYRLNTVGLRRQGVTGERYRSLEAMYRAMRNGEELTPGDTEETRYLYDWLQQESKRGLSGFQK